MSFPTTNFYIEKPRDTYWNVGFGKPTIIQAQSNPNHLGHLQVLEPASFPWKSVSQQLFLKCSGPVRQLTFDEYVKLIHQLEPTRALPKGKEAIYRDLFTSAVEKKDQPTVEALEFVALKNGAQVAKPVVITTMIALRQLQQDNLDALVDLLELCKNDSTDPSLTTCVYNLPTLQKLGLVDGNSRVLPSIPSRLESTSIMH